MRAPRILLISRAHPPVIGGIEKQNAELFSALAARASTINVVNRRGKRWLPLFFARALYSLWRFRRDYDAVLLGDGVLAPAAWAMKLFSEKPVLCVVHGLDITYPNTLYQRIWVAHFLNSVDRFVAVGKSTIEAAVQRGLPPEKFVFIPNAIGNVTQRPASGSALGELIAQRKQTGPVLLTLGRLVRRKGVDWFITNVMPRLDASISLFVAGEGSERAAIERSIRDAGLEHRVTMLGQVSEDEKALLLSEADLFLQPNIRVEGDMEGFGLVVLEAACHGTYVVAAAIEGLKDAIADGENGALVETENPDAFSHTITTLLSEPRRLEELGKHAAQYVECNFNWDKIAELYLQNITLCLGREL